MPTFSTNPKWYNSAGVLDRSLTGVANKNSGYDNIAIGYSSRAGSSSATNGINSAIAIGYDAMANSADSIAIGSRSSEDYGTYAYADGAISIGAGSQVRGSGAIGIGYGASIEGFSSIAIGNKAVANEGYTIQLGNNDTEYTVRFGNKTMLFENNPIPLNGGNWIQIAVSVGAGDWDPQEIDPGFYVVKGNVNGNGIIVSVVCIPYPESATQKMYVPLVSNSTGYYFLEVQRATTANKVKLNIVKHTSGTTYASTNVSTQTFTRLMKFNYVSLV